MLKMEKKPVNHRTYLDAATGRVRVLKCERVRVEASARLHGGFHRLPDVRGNKSYAGIGFYIEEPRVTVEASIGGAGKHWQVEARGPYASHAERLARMTLDKLKPGIEGLEVRVTNSIPPHAGLGSTTQIVLSVAAALHALTTGRPPSTGEIHYLSHRLGRGRRSLAGTLLYASGGVVVDAGAPAEPPYTPLYHGVLPSDWVFVLFEPELPEGLSGREEEEAFTRLPLAGEHIVGLQERGLARLLLGLARMELDTVIDGLRMIQTATGMYFRGAQRGVYRSDLERVADEAWRDGIFLAQSSWGPTLYTLTDRGRAWSDAKTLRMIAGLHGLKARVHIVEPRSTPALVECS